MFGRMPNEPGLILTLFALMLGLTHWTQLLGNLMSISR
jgi:hypothetical protein